MELSQFIEVSVGGRTLRLSPLKRNQLLTARDTANKLVAAVGKPLSAAWIADMEDGIGLIFLSARVADPDLPLNDLYEGTAEEICAALDALGVLTMEFYSNER